MKKKTVVIINAFVQTSANFVQLGFFTAGLNKRLAVEGNYRPSSLCYRYDSDEYVYHKYLFHVLEDMMNVSRS